MSMHTSAAEIAKALHGRKTGSGWQCRCPAHDDGTPSLSVSDGDKGVVVKCHAGCSQDAVIAALKAKGLWGTGSGSRTSFNIVATYDYTTETGELLFQVCRLDPKDFRQRKPDGNGGWLWSVKGITKVPYRLPELAEAIAGERTIFIVEGEKDVNNLAHLGIPATCNAGGAEKWQNELCQHFTGANVVIIPDKDETGRRHADDVAGKLQRIAARVRVLELEVKDASEWLEAGGTSQELYRLVDELAVPFLGQGEAPTTAPENRQLASLPWLDMSNWDDEPIPEREWSIRNRVPLRQAGLFSGEGGTGKSIIELQKNVAHVMGRDWVGSLPELGPAFYIGAEDDEREIHIRLAAIAQHYGVSFGELTAGGLHILPLLGKDATLCAVTRGGKVEVTGLYNQLYEAAGDIKPKNISVDTLSRAFAGNEIDRVQVYAFAQHMQALAMVAHGSVTILSHPSLQGINSGSGISGSTAWHGAFRFRQYLKGVKLEAGEQPDSDLRELEFKKNQYGPLGESIVLRYQNGLFLPERGVTDLDRLARKAKAQEVFLDLLRRFDDQNRNVGDKPTSPNYAPATFAKEDEARKHRLTKDELKQAMLDLYKAGTIINVDYGRPARPASKIALKG